jgi:hypothetical protein
MRASLIHPEEKKIVSSSHFFLGLPGKELSLERLGDAHAKDNYRNGISGNSKSNVSRNPRLVARIYYLIYTKEETGS